MKSRNLRSLGYFALISVAALISPSMAHATAGVGAGGGGSQIESAFRLRGYGLIVRVAGNVRANALCASTVMQKSLDTTRIRVVDQLINPSTNKPIGGNLDAWTRPGDMQLLKGSWQFLVNPAAPQRLKHDGSVGLLILHEIYRTTGSCNDDNFQLSGKVFSLLQGSGEISQFSEMFAFKYAYWVVTLDTSDSPELPGVYHLETPKPLALWYRMSANLDTSQFPVDDTDVAICNQPLEAPQVKKFTCLSLSGELYTYKDLIRKGDASFPSSDDFPYQGITMVPDLITQRAEVSQKIPDFGGKDLQNQWTHVSLAHPFLVVHDIQNGTWSWAMQ